MTTAHTPTTWRYEAGTKTIRSVPANYWLATLDSWDGAVKDSTEANGRLMAAAPALLAALKYLIWMTRDGAVFGRDACITQARAAIAAAETTTAEATDGPGSDAYEDRQRAAHGETT